MNIAKYLFAVLLLVGVSACGQDGGDAPAAADDGASSSMDLDAVVDAAEAAADEVADEASEMAEEGMDAAEEMAGSMMEDAAADLPDL
jgi:hypothetical protein